MIDSMDSYIFFTKINKFSDATRLSAKFIVDEVYSEEETNTIQTSSDENLLVKKKLKFED